MLGPKLTQATIPTVKYGDSSIMYWGMIMIFRRWPSCPNWKENGCRKIQGDITCCSPLKNLKLARFFTFQEDNVPRHKTKATQKWLKTKRWNGGENLTVRIEKSVPKHCTKLVGTSLTNIKVQPQCTSLDGLLMQAAFFKKSLTSNDFRL